MYLRKLELKDASFMLEWMHDSDVIKNLRNDFSSKTILDCELFILNQAKDSIHLAIVNENDEYMGTVSLKHIIKDSAEFGITVRKSAMGNGYSKFAMLEMIKRGFEMGLNTIYWCVDPLNFRAIRFYEKLGYQRIPFEHLIVIERGRVQRERDFSIYLVSSGKIIEGIIPSGCINHKVWGE